MSQAAQQQQQAAVSSGQITSMQQHGAGGAVDGKNASSIFDVAFIKGIGEYQGSSLSNIGLNKVFGTENVVGGIQAPGPKTLGKLIDGLEFSGDMGPGQEGEQQAQQGQMSAEDRIAQDQQQQQQQQQMQQQGQYDPSMTPEQQQQMQQQQGQLPHGYGPDQNGQQAMGMGGQDNANRGDNGTPHGFGDSNDDKGMFGTFDAERGPYYTDAFAGSGSRDGGNFEDSQRQRYQNQGYRPDDDESGGGSSDADDNSTQGADKQGAFPNAAPVPDTAGLAGDAAQAGGPEQTPGRDAIEEERNAGVGRGA